MYPLHVQIDKLDEVSRKSGGRRGGRTSCFCSLGTKPPETPHSTPRILNHSAWVQQIVNVHKNVC